MTDVVKKEPTHKKILLKQGAFTVYHGEGFQGSFYASDDLIQFGNYTVTPADLRRGWIDLDEVAWR